MMVESQVDADAKKAIKLPVISRQQLRWFQLYIRYYLRRNFHAVHFLRLASMEEVTGYPLLVCMNHPSWWDPLLALYLSNHFFKERLHYGPIASEGLAKYKFFERLGFFGIHKATRAGAARFLRIGGAVLDRADCALWVTPQGEFTDVRQKPVAIEAGVGHLAHRLERFAMLPVTFEYAFWNERSPEAFVCFGRPILSESGRDRTAEAWTQSFAGALAATQDALSSQVQRRQASGFEPLLSGVRGVGGMYDIWRAFKAWLSGKAWQPDHGSR